MMSRRAGPADEAAVVDAPADAKSSHPSSPRVKPAPPVPGDMGYTASSKTAGKGVTREEMVRLFGNALRVR